MLSLSLSGLFVDTGSVSSDECGGVAALALWQTHTFYTSLHLDHTKYKSQIIETELNHSGCPEKMLKFIDFVMEVERLIQQRTFYEQILYVLKVLKSDACHDIYIINSHLLQPADPSDA